MRLNCEEGLLAASDTAFSDREREIFRQLVRFVNERLEAARELQHLIAAMPSDAGSGLDRRLHAFLRECWDALDGLGRLVNVCLHEQFPDAGLYPPDRMTRQCTFYTVRRALCSHPDTAPHPLAEYLSVQTRLRPNPAYERLSFLYNLSIFVPLPLTPDGSLPGWDDVPAQVRPLARSCGVKGCSVAEGTADILGWLNEFAEGCCLLMKDALEERAAD